MSPKASFDEYYQMYSPQPYVSYLVKRLDYRLPFKAMNLLKEYLDRIDDLKELETVIIGSAHGLDAAALKYGYSYEQILSLWLENHPENHIFSNGDPRFKITMVDINEQPLRFAHDVGLCDQFFSCDLTEEFPDELSFFLDHKTDLLICVGATTYLGLWSFSRFISFVKEGKIKYFCFSLASFICDSFLEICQEAHLELKELGKIKQRNYEDEQEKSRILDILKAENRYFPEDEEALMTSIYIAQKV